jgi:hypothetical protein
MAAGRLGRFIPLLAWIAVVSTGRLTLQRTGGVVSWLLVGLVVVAGILVIDQAARLCRPAAPGHRLRLFALAAGSVALTLAGIELGLAVAERVMPSASAMTMPREWERRPVPVAGAAYAYYWHNVLHVHNDEHMRVAGRFPEHRPGFFRILVVGDSLTYGYGVAADDAYPSVLERRLGRDFRVEVLNLGVSGAQSEDIRRTVGRALTQLQPDLIVYGVCLNDFLPSGVGEYATNRAYPVPVPYGDHFILHTRMGKLVEELYDSVLMTVGLRADFFTDILRDFNGYQTRFARDVAAMNGAVVAGGLPAVVAMVLNQFPDTRGPGHPIVLAAERHLQDAGIRVIPADYIRRNDGRRDWFVSRWEGHPNQKAHSAFADEIAAYLAGLPELQPFRRGRTPQKGDRDASPEHG